MLNLANQKKYLRSLSRSLCFIALSVVIHIIIVLVLSRLPIQPTNRNWSENEFVVTISSISNKTVIDKKPSEHPKDMLESRVTSAHPAIMSKPDEPGRIITNQFYEIRELDRPIKPLSDIHPEYSNSKEMTVGKMTLDLYLDETGKVESVFVSESTLPKHFEEVAVNSFLYKNFEQGLIKGAPVKVHLRIKLEVVPENLLSAPQ